MRTGLPFTLENISATFACVSKAASGRRGRAVSSKSGQIFFIEPFQLSELFSIRCYLSIPMDESEISLEYERGTSA